MTIRRFLIAYFGVIALLGASGAVTLHALKQRQASMIAANVQPSVAAGPATAEVQPQPAAEAANPSSIAPLPIPALRPHQPTKLATKSTTKASGKPHAVAAATRAAPHHYAPPDFYAGPPGSPSYGPPPYPMPPRFARFYPYYPGYGYPYPYYPRPGYYPTF